MTTASVTSLQLSQEPVESATPQGDQSLKESVEHDEAYDRAVQDVVHFILSLDDDSSNEPTERNHS